MNVINKRLMSSGLDYICKKRKLASDLLKKRLEDRKNKKFPVNTANIQVLGDGTQGTSPSLLLNSEGRTYLFNCNAGLQRACFSNRIRLADLEHIFLTSLDCDNISGVYGITLTVGDLGLPNLCIHSTSRINGIFKSLHAFSQHSSDGIQCSERVYPPGYYQDPGLKVQPIVINDDHYPESHVRGGSKKLKSIIAYVCQLPDVAGALNPLRCKELKVPIGPLLATLKSGKDITLQDGTLVKSSDVCEPSQPGCRFMVIECPTKKHIELLMTCEELTRIIEDSNQQRKNLDLIFHLSPEVIVQDKRYQDWMASFKSPKSKHLLVSHSESDRLFFADFRRNQYLLHQLDDKIFSFPYFTPRLKSMVEDDMKKVRKGPIIQPTNTLNIFDLAESKELKYNSISQLDDLNKQKDLYHLDRIVMKPKRFVESPDELLDLTATYREVSQFENFDKNYELIKDVQKKFPRSKEYEPEVIFLGTGSAVPSKYRNTSGILINFPYPESKSVILDCGEDTYGQIFRLYGSEETEKILRNLRLIYVSHFHADHHVGLLQIVQKRAQLVDEPITLILPPSIESTLNYYNHIEDISKKYRIFQSRFLKSFPKDDITIDCDLSTKSLKSDLYDATFGFLENLDIVEVDHCAHACGVAMEFKIGHPEMQSFKLSYSGDCRPSDSFAQIGKHSDLLIHEATMDDRTQDDAEAKKHCTTGEAIDISRKMDAKYTILTHFSQRFAKIPIFTEEMDDKIGFAFDFVRIRCPSDYGRLSALKPLLNVVYRESVELIEDKFKRETEKKLVKDVLLKERAAKVN